MRRSTHSPTFPNVDMITADSRSARLMSVVGGHLAKRDCVQNCPAPSCANVQCASDELCVFTAQTCQSCPTTSCVSINGIGATPSSSMSNDTSSSTTLPARSANKFPAGAVAAVIVVGVLLMLGLVSLGFWYRRRKRLIASGAYTTKEHYDDEGPYDHGSLARPGCGSVRIALDNTARPQILSSIAPSEGVSLIAMSEALRRTPSDSQTLPICLDDDTLRSANSRLLTYADLAGIDGNKHFFGADELMRMSYAASRTSLVSGPNTLSRHVSGVTTHTNRSVVSGGDHEAAIIQANNQVMGVRARANVVQLTKPSTTSTKSPAQSTRSSSIPEEFSLVIVADTEGDSPVTMTLPFINEDLVHEASQAKSQTQPPTQPQAQSQTQPQPQQQDAFSSVAPTLPPLSDITIEPPVGTPTQTQQFSPSISSPSGSVVTAPLSRASPKMVSATGSRHTSTLLNTTSSFLDFDTDSIPETPVERDFITPRHSFHTAGSASLPGSPLRKQ